MKIKDWYQCIYFIWVPSVYKAMDAAYFLGLRIHFWHQFLQKNEPLGWLYFSCSTEVHRIMLLVYWNHQIFRTQHMCAKFKYPLYLYPNENYNVCHKFKLVVLNFISCMSYCECDTQTLRHRNQGTQSVIASDVAGSMLAMCLHVCKTNSKTWACA